VFTGGSANLAGLVPVAEQLLHMPARVGFPEGMSGLTDAIYNPAYATSVGLLLWSIRYGGHNGRARGQAFPLFEWFQNLLAGLKVKG
jgi:cell division protein FtsA